MRTHEFGRDLCHYIDNAVFLLSVQYLLYYRFRRLRILNKNSIIIPADVSRDFLSYFQCTGAKQLRVVFR